MKIALLAPFEESVPPKAYGGTEQVVFNLAEELVKMGHDVTLLAAGNSVTSARLIPCTDQDIRPYLDTNARSWFYLYWQGFHRAVKVLKNETFDIVHNHFDWPFLVLDEMLSYPIITTIHNPFQFTFAAESMYDHLPFVSISNAQRKTIPHLNFVDTVYNGLDVSKFEFNDKPQNYLAYLGRISPDKGTLEAITIAKRTRHKLIMAARIDQPDRRFFNKSIKPLIDGEQIIYLGEVPFEEKVKLLKNAQALLSPIQWDEPFGLVNIEALACGTPVITMRRGALPEIITDRKTGFLCDTLDEVVQAIKEVRTIDRIKCRKRVESNFTSKRMAEKYLKAYQKVIENGKTKKKK